MTATLPRLFSKRHEDALRAKKIKPSLPRRLRRRVWLILSEYDYAYYVNLRRTTCRPESGRAGRSGMKIAAEA